MAQVTLKGSPVNTNGELPKTGSKAPDFVLTNSDLSELKLSDYKGQKVILNIFPSLDTSVCATSIRTFNKEAASLDNTVVLSISRDLPFAHTRFCSTEGIDKAIPASEFKNDNFGKAYGIRIIDGPMEGLFARSVVVVDESGTVKYTELVPEIAQEPDYKKALDSL